MTSAGDEEKLSRALSRLLRHSAQQEGLPISHDGWISVEAVIRYLARSHPGLRADVALVRKLVAHNNKQRFALQEDPELRIRANQGHTMSGINVAMTLLTPDRIERAVHGTYYDAWRKIRTAGLSCMKRQHVHLARGLPGETGIISGMRSSCTVLIWVDVRSAIQAGMEFYESANGVILTRGFDGVVPPRFFISVCDRKSAKPVSDWNP
eukprot:6182332-Pleurochrysis_carterae.AAC.1